MSAAMRQLAATFRQAEPRPRFHSALAVATCTVLVAVACGTESGDTSNDSNVGDESLGPVYALVTQVYGPEDRTVYFWLTDTLDPEEVTLKDAREYPGVTNLNVVGERVLVSSGQEPTITEFEIGPDLEWQEGRTLSFGRYPLYDNANWYYQFVLDEHTAYLPFDGSKRVVWDPSEMTITAVMDDSSVVFEQDTLLLEAGGNRNGVSYRDRVLQAFFYRDEDWYEFGEESVIVAYDPETHEENDVIVAPCPGLALATLDEEGNTYFSTWDYSPGLALYGEAKAPCAVKVTSDGELDESWTTDFLDQTDGRFVMNFRYVGDGKAIANVLHDEELEIDRDGPSDIDVILSLWETGPHWKLWMFDLQSDSAWPIEGINVELGSGAQFAVLDGRTFVFVPFDDWSRTKVYELDDDGVAREHFEILGDVFKWVRVR